MTSGHGRTHENPIESLDHGEEFGRIGGLVPLGGDTILVADGRNHRLTLIEGLRYLSDRRFEGFFAEGLYEPAVRTMNGSWILRPRAFGLRGNEESGWKRYPVLRTVDFATVDTIASVPLMHFSNDHNPVQHFGVVVAAGGEVAHAMSEHAEVTWIEPDGTVRQIARWDAAAIVATAEHWPAYERGLRERARDIERLEAVLPDRKRDFGGTIPFFRKLHGDRAGHVWLGRYDPARLRSAVYDVLSSQGGWLGSVAFPGEIRILDITDSHVLGVERDELDVEAIVLYTLIKPS